ncbi:hypothetical protein [Peribacillus sp. YIM B13477]|uniref:hypothetical protein n=1 Tax=Peribacillus sp. YIM B13477 TaxID=3366300 RepID=UPI003672ED72
MKFSQEIIEFEFVIGAGERKMIELKVDIPLMLRMFQVDREHSTIPLIGFDNKDMKHVNGQMNKHLKKTFRLNERISFVCSMSETLIQKQ